MKLSEKLSKIQPSATLAITSKAKSMKAAGEDVVVLAAGEPDFDTPEIVKEAAIKAIKDGLTKYTPAGGTKTLKEAICRKFKKDNNLDYDISEIAVSNGAKHSLYNVLQAVCDPADEVIIISPYWVSYPEMIMLAGAVPKVIATKPENGFKVRAEEIKSAINEKTRAIILNSPSNPAGVVYEEKDLKEIAEVCLQAGIMIISDEIYEKIAFDGREHLSIASLSSAAREASIIVNGVSKSYAMTGWRIGYMAGNKKIISMVTTLQSHSTSNPCSISQAAAQSALVSDLEGKMKENCEKFEQRRNFLVKSLSEVRGLTPFNPAGAFYLFCDISATGMNSMDFSKRLLDEEKVAVVPGRPFGEDSFVRISFACSMQTLEKGARRIKEWLDN